MENQIYIYGGVGDWGVSAAGVATALENARGNPVTVRINSPGGSVSEGVAIYNLLKTYAGKTVAVVDGIAASIASVIAMGANEVVMGEGSLMFVHQPWVSVDGNSGELRKVADDLEKFSASILGIYTSATNQAENVIRAIMDKETFLTAQEAVDLGFADRIESGQQINTGVKNMSFVASFRNAIPVSEAFRAAGIEFTADSAKSVIEAAQNAKTAGVSEAIIKAFEAANIDPAAAVADQFAIAKAIAKAREDAEAEAVAASKDQAALITALQTEKQAITAQVDACSQVLAAIGVKANAEPAEIKAALEAFASKQAANILANHGANQPIPDDLAEASKEKVGGTDAEIYAKYQGIKDPVSRMAFYQANAEAIWRARSN